MADVERSSLRKALRVLFGVQVDDVSYSSDVLQGGTVGDVSKISGTAFSGSHSQPFSIVVKTQKKWERFGDPDCWRREYDIYKEGLVDTLPPTIRFPACYLLEEGEGYTRIWMEFIEGRTGDGQLQATELSLASERLGELQAAFSLHGSRDLPYLRGYPAVRSSFDLWWGRMKKPLSSEMEGFPDAMRNILNAYAARSGEVLDLIEGMPLTLCQGDVHHDNLIFRKTSDGTDIYLIDWDSAGYGSMGEDAVDMLMEAFVYSDRDVSLLPEFQKRIIGGYVKGAGKGGVAFSMDDAMVRDVTALAWGFRIADHYLYFKDAFSKKRCVDILNTMLG